MISMTTNQPTGDSPYPSPYLFVRNPDRDHPPESLVIDTQNNQVYSLPEGNYWGTWNPTDNAITKNDEDSSIKRLDMVEVLQSMEHLFNHSITQTTQLPQLQQRGGDSDDQGEQQEDVFQDDEPVGDEGEGVPPGAVGETVEVAVDKPGEGKQGVAVVEVAGDEPEGEGEEGVAGDEPGGEGEE